MKTIRFILTLCLLTTLFTVCASAFSRNNPKPVYGGGTISQGPTGTGASPTPRPVNGTTLNLR